jgi:hypothetical protein
MTYVQRHTRIYIILSTCTKSLWYNTLGRIQYVCNIIRHNTVKFFKKHSFQGGRRQLKILLNLRCLNNYLSCLKMQKFSIIIIVITLLPAHVNEIKKL